MRVRPCFLVNVRKATGRRVPGGRRTGRTVAGRIVAVVVVEVETLVVLCVVGAAGAGAAAGPVRRGLLKGCRGVPKPGEEDGIGFGFGLGLGLEWDSSAVSAIMTLFFFRTLRDFSLRDDLYFAQEFGFILQFLHRIV